MDELTIKNFRCFGDLQKARLAPLTFLVGENSTGKTSLLAMIRILWRVVCQNDRLPDFKDPPYDLGSFQELIHQREGNVGQSEIFSAGFRIKDWKCEATFGKGGAATELSGLHIENEEASVTWNFLSDDHFRVRLKTGNGQWQYDTADDVDPELEFRRMIVLDEWISILLLLSLDRDILRSVEGSSEITPQDKDALHRLLFAIRRIAHRPPPAAAAPVRSQPKRTYDPGFASLDPEGASAPAFLAKLRLGNKIEWEKLRSAIESHGRKTGLFDKLRIRQLGETEGSDPFQVQVQKWGQEGRGTWRNLVDVGYGVSQMLPVIIELVKSAAPDILLLQQPEIHLHPSAEAGLGSILCDIASEERQILVETHSDYLLDRVRSDIRDRKTGLKPEDVSILFFERVNESTTIHNLGIDSEGNVLGCPASYRQFFMDEMDRSLGC